MRRSRLLTSSLLAPVVLSAFVSVGCSSPVSTGVKLGAKVVGRVVNDQETKSLGQQLVGQSPSAADQELGTPVNVLADINGSRTWRVYRPQFDPLDMKRYVVAIDNNRIVSVETVSRDTGKIDIARKLVLEQKVKGKTATDAEASLGLGSPLLVVRSETTGQLSRLYDARTIKGIGGMRYCVLRFDGEGVCTALDMVEVDASA